VSTWALLLARAKAVPLHIKNRTGLDKRLAV
jgi:hypothetical protein